MYNILFLEDRTDRQSSFLPNGVDDISLIKTIGNLHMPDPNGCKHIVEQINKQEYQFNSINHDIKLVIVHRTLLKNSGISFLNQIAKKNQFKLVFFSGGISQVQYNNDGFEQIFLNSTEFYSELLIPFLFNFSTDFSTSILELFHKNWRLSYMMLHRQLSQNLKVSKVDESDPYTYYYATKERLKQIETILGVTSENEIDKLFKKSVLAI
jgi:hypothetical protein